MNTNQKGPTRRGFLTGAGATAAAATLTACGTGGNNQPMPDNERMQQIPDNGTAVVTLGTAGGPRPHHRAAPSTAIVTNGRWHLVDCGSGTIRQLEAAGVSPADIESMWFTHHHSDHNMDYAAVLILGWLSGRTGPLPVFGPPGTQGVTDEKLSYQGTQGFNEATLGYQSIDVAVRIADEGRPPPKAKVTDVNPGSRINLGGGVTVSVAEVHHPPITTFAYRFNTSGGSVTVSGDTSPSDNLVRLAKGSDILVHEVMHTPALGVILNQVGAKATSLRKHLLESHTTTEQVGGIARRAGVGELVLTHLVPSNPGAVSEESWVAGPSRDFPGPVWLAHDLAVRRVV